MDRIDKAALRRVSGPAWEGLRDLFVKLSSVLLDVSPDARSELTTIYVKFTIDSEPSSAVYAVAWLKSSKKIDVGLALPEDYEHQDLCAPPAGMKYKGLTRYFSVVAHGTIPGPLVDWAKTAYERVAAEPD